ncbi:S9 family peptidase [Glutamicibacter protophormiae]|uniref:Dipeptidyl aminopeptidase/acylaminoacyl peptidase n=1 Tax=Glutamicibacter protophormiae TaxID=37930 RepID=A0ABS4XKW4_GLUPR|nr:prolyl oligopeptidase family serine peptidase [Glutamicibacter protophormiae]MBP2397146.1 dipeptidyl aminopeptidase/acylaminoacyl peptidase [Glutamicibacter protophormiae]GGM01831.1 dipeptidyl aminopeptidase [Glutamicibacter protophormiae]
MPSKLPYGSWPSTISAHDVAAGTKPLGGASFHGQNVIVQEGRPAEGGRITLVSYPLDSQEEPTELISKPYNVRSRVHEYGGASWKLVTGRLQDAIVFSNFADQRVYLQQLGQVTPIALTPDSMSDGNPQLRFAEFIDGPNRTVLAIMEDLRAEPVRHIVQIPLDGSAGQDATRIRVLTAPARFVAAPRLSPSGTMLAWISWEHPNMPWDGTELHLAEVSGNGQLEDTVIAGAEDISIMQPEWVDENRIAYLSDESGWWNPYIHQVSSARATRLVDRAAEFAGPLWQVGSAWYVLEDQRTLLCSYGTGTTKLARVHALTGGLEDLPLPFTRVRPLQVRDGWLLAGTSSMTDGEQITLVNLDTLEHRPVAGSIARLPDPAMLPQVEEFECANEVGQAVHALLYRPRQEGLTGLDGELPPFVTFVHGGPTAQAAATLNAAIAYYTSRGIGVVDVNYGGSTGYGRDYRNRLRGQWGIVDVADTISVIKALVARGIADPARIGIEGGSAGGWTVLSALTSSEVFSAGISRYGVADLVALVQDTHDFESQYMFSLVGPYPEAADVYEKRAPINHVSKISCPVLLLQGDEDLVVPPAQSQVVADALAARGIPHAYILFAGEQHGFRQSENIISALESSLAFYGQIFGFETDAPAIELS